MFRQAMAPAPLLSKPTMMRPAARVCRMPLRAYHAPRAASSARVPTSRYAASIGLLAGGSLLLGGSLLSPFAPIKCDAAGYAHPPVPQAVAEKPKHPESIVNLYQLSFGTVCGLCAGIFIKKGLKLIAVLLGGTYVLLQYLASKRIITMNWGALRSRYAGQVERLAGPVDGSKSTFEKYPFVRIWHRTVDFLTCDFQERATFIAGLVLGLRLG